MSISTPVTIEPAKNVSFRPQMMGIAIHLMASNPLT